MRFLIVFIFLWTNLLPAQGDTITLNFKAKYANEALVFNNMYDNKLHFTMFKCYVSNFKFFKAGQLVHSTEHTYFLLNFDDKKSLMRTIPFPKEISFDEIQFTLGIDASTNEAGIGEGELDPTYGMYWTWNTGYIHVKIEGTSTTCPTKDHGFQYHLGGYIEDNNTAQTISFKVVQENSFTFSIDLKKFFASLDLKKEHTFMSPSPKAVQLSQKLAQSFLYEK